MIRDFLLSDFTLADKMKSSLSVLEKSPPNKLKLLLMSFRPYWDSNFFLQDKEALDFIEVHRKVGEQFPNISLLLPEYQLPPVFIARGVLEFQLVHLLALLQAASKRDRAVVALKVQLADDRLLATWESMGKGNFEDSPHLLTLHHLSITWGVRPGTAQYFKGEYTLA